MKDDIRGVLPSALRLLAKPRADFNRAADVIFTDLT
jgi:hypothetical protein